MSMIPRTKEETKDLLGKVENMSEDAFVLNELLDDLTDSLDELDRMLEEQTMRRSDVKARLLSVSSKL